MHEHDCFRPNEIATPSLQANQYVDCSQAVLLRSVCSPVCRLAI